MIVVNLTVNGTAVKREVDERTLLLEFLREELNLTGTHDGCREAKCGCCTVLVNGKSVKSCNALASQVDGTQVTTVEGLAPIRLHAVEDLTIERLAKSFEPIEVLGPDPRELHPLQAAFRKNGAVQCGYCTPGMLMAAVDLLKRNPNPSRAEVRLGISSVICRCTGYQAVVDAIIEAAATLRSRGEEAVSPSGVPDSAATE